jgi:GNAT superfamily N-acetyltransferase
MRQDAFGTMRLRQLPAGIEALRLAARNEGFRFVERLVAEWHAGINRFDQPGEVLLGATHADALVAICGLNRDPYAADPGIARLRHLYVLPRFRRQDIATGLVSQVLRQAEDVFQTIRLRTETREAARFYERHSFIAVEGDDASHVKPLSPLLGG